MYPHMRVMHLDQQRYPIRGKFLAQVPSFLPMTEKLADRAENEEKLTLVKQIGQGKRNFCAKFKKVSNTFYITHSNIY